MPARQRQAPPAPTKPKQRQTTATKARRAAPTPPAFPPLLVTVNDAAHLLCVSRDQVYRLINTGMLPSLKIGRYRRISIRALETYVNGPTLAAE